MPCLRILWRQLLKNIAMFENANLEFLNFQSFIQNKYTLSLVLKMPFWINLVANLKKLLTSSKSAPPNLSYVKFHLKQKHFGTKMLYLGTVRS